MSTPLTPYPAYLITLSTQLHQFLNTLELQLGELEETQQELNKAQTWLLQNSAPLYALTYISTVSTYLANQYQAILQLTRITSQLLAVIQALLHSHPDPPWDQSNLPRSPTSPSSLYTGFFYLCPPCPTPLSSKPKFPTMSQSNGNRFLPLQDDEEEVIMDGNPQVDNPDGWNDDISLPSSTSGTPAQGASREKLQYRRRKKDKKDKLVGKVKKKKTSLKIKHLPESTPPTPAGPDWCLKEAERLWTTSNLGVPSVLSSLQEAAIRIGFPLSTFKTVDTMPSMGRGKLLSKSIRHCLR